MKDARKSVALPLLLVGFMGAFISLSVTALVAMRQIPPDWLYFLSFASVHVFAFGIVNLLAKVVMNSTLFEGWPSRLRALSRRMLRPQINYLNPIEHTPRSRA